MRTYEHLARRVHEFHVKQRLYVGEGPILPVQLMRLHLVMEEASEGLLALHNHDESKFVDSLGDVMYVTAGAWVAIYGERIPRMTIPRAQKPPHFHWMTSRFLTNIRELNKALADCVTSGWAESTVLDLIKVSVVMCAEAGYDPVDVFNAIADSNDTKWYKEENGQRVKDKGPDFRIPVLTPLLKGW